VRLNSAPVTRTTDFVDTSARAGVDSTYSVRSASGKEADKGSAGVRVQAGGFVSIKLDHGETVQKVGIGDLDGDGRYDYVIKQPQDNIDPALPWWTPSPDTYKLEAYTHDGRRLWRKDLGWSIERGIWYSPYIVFDLDGDGRAEVAVKTGEGDPRGTDGRVETGPEWVSILDGTTGKELARDDWPARQTPGEKYNYNLSSRNQMCVAYLDGRSPCLVVERGTYTTIRLVAYQFRRGRGLEKVWTWDSREEAGRGLYSRQGAHIMHAADVDGDGRDEVILGSAVVDDNGNGLWTTGFGHPDFCFVGDIDPARPGLEIFYGIEPAHEKNGLCLVEARTGKLLWGLQQPTTPVGADGMCADIDGAYPGSECHAVNLDGKRHYDRGWLFSAGGRLLSEQRQRTMSQPVYWDADPQRELLRGREICDFQPASRGAPGVKKLEPQIAGHLVAIADVLGDWREEIITSTPGELRIYTTTIPACDRHACLMQDPIYRIDVAVAAMGYYGAPMLSYDMATQKAK
jgi:rhamnogalacturonan endolyase